MAMTHGVVEDRLHIAVTEPLPREIHPYWGLLALALIFFAAIASGIGYAATRPQFGTQAVGAVGSAHELLRDEKREIAFTTDQVIVFSAKQKTIIVPYETPKALAKGTAVTVTYNRADPNEYKIYDTGAFTRVLILIAALTILLGAWGSLAIVRHIRRGHEAGEF
jgi:hypothetical protein